MTDDDQLRHLLDAAIPRASDADVEHALTQVHQQAQRQRRRNHVVGPWLAAATTAIAVAAILTVAVLALGARSHRPAQPPATGPGIHTPGVWFRHSAGRVTTPTGTIDLAAVWVLRLATPTSGTFDVRPTNRFGAGTLRYNPTTRVWTVHVLDHYCGATAGLYHVTQSGTSLVLTAVNDTCTARRDALDEAVFAPLTNPNQLIG